jgi:hypothetical protein
MISTSRSETTLSQLETQRPRMKQQNDTAILVNISTQKWPPRQRTYFGSLQIASPELGHPYALTPIPRLQGEHRPRRQTQNLNAISAREIAKTCPENLTAIRGREVTTACSSPRARNLPLRNWPKRVQSWRRSSAGPSRSPISSGSARTIPCSTKSRPKPSATHPGAARRLAPSETAARAAFAPAYSRPTTPQRSATQRRTAA